MSAMPWSALPRAIDAATSLRMDLRLPLAAAACALAACSSTRQTSEPIGTSTERLSTGLVISQIYPGGGNAGATYTSDYVEIFNRGSTAVALAGASIQSRGTGATWHEHWRHEHWRREHWRHERYGRQKRCGHRRRQG